MKSTEISLLSFLVIILSSAGGQESIKPSVTAYWGKSVELPCEISRPPYAVFWYQHSSTDAPDEDARVVVQNFDGIDTARAGPRFEITSDFSLMIHNVTVQDETAYSCRVAWLDDHILIYTHLRVVALADELTPITVDNCQRNGWGGCVYYIDPSASTIQLKCEVTGVRPAVNLTWTDALTGEEVPSGETNRMVDWKTGLVTVYRVTPISGSDIGKNRICQAHGEAVGGTSNLTVLLLKEPRDCDFTALAVATVLTLFVLVVVAAAVICWFLGRRSRERRTDGEGVPLKSALECEIEKKREKIREYRPGEFSRRDMPDGVQLPSQVKLSVIGQTAAGKSSFVRSLDYAVSGNFTDAIEIAGEMTTGGLARTTKGYRLTRYVIVEDNRGLKDLDSKRIPELFTDLQERGVHCVILVYNSLLPIAELNEFLFELTKTIREKFDNHPVLVLTHRDETESEIEMNTILDEAIAVGALDQKLFFVENFTKSLEDNDEELGKRTLEFLGLFLKLLDFADDNLVQCACAQGDINACKVVTAGKGNKKGIQQQRPWYERIRNK